MKLAAASICLLASALASPMAEPDALPNAQGPQMPPNQNNQPNHPNNPPNMPGAGGPNPYWQPQGAPKGNPYWNGPQPSPQPSHWRPNPSPQPSPHWVPNPSPQPSPHWVPNPSPQPSPHWRPNPSPQPSPHWRPNPSPQPSPHWRPNPSPQPSPYGPPNPSPPTPTPPGRRPSGGGSSQLNYIQKYHGEAGGFTYDLKAGTFSAKWNGNTDFVVGLGWSGTVASTITYSATFTASGGAYLMVYGWLHSPETEWSIVDNYGSYNPCSQATRLGTLESDGGSYEFCTHQVANAPSITGTSGFVQFISVRTSKRSSGTVTTGNHFRAWAEHGFGNSDFAFGVMAVESYAGSGSASVTVS